MDAIFFDNLLFFPPHQKTHTLTHTHTHRDSFYLLEEKLCGGWGRGKMKTLGRTKIVSDLQEQLICCNLSMEENSFYPKNVPAFDALNSLLKFYLFDYCTNAVSQF